MPKKTSFALSLFLHVVLLFIILSIFFRFVISKTESQAIGSELKDNIEKIFQNLPQDKTLKTYINNNDNILNTLKNYYSKPEPAVEIQNRNLFLISIMVSVFLVIIVVGAMVLLHVSCGYCVNLKELILENVVIFAFIGSIEYMFFKQIASKYIPIKPDYLVQSFIDQLKNKFNA
ncbi:hypothetical protein OAF54_03695 [bacterium]|nr:hypothetical protein [bacterium]